MMKIIPLRRRNKDELAKQITKAIERGIDTKRGLIKALAVDPIELDAFDEALKKKYFF